MTSNEIIDSLMSANALAEATLLKIKTNSAEEAKWKIDALYALGKAQVAAIERRKVA